MDGHDVDVALMPCCAGLVTARKKRKAVQSDDSDLDDDGEPQTLSRDPRAYRPAKGKGGRKRTRERIMVNDFILSEVTEFGKAGKTVGENKHIVSPLAKKVMARFPMAQYGIREAKKGEFAVAAV